MFQVAFQRLAAKWKEKWKWKSPAFHFPEAAAAAEAGSVVRLSDLQPGLTRLAHLQPGLTRRDLQDLVSQVLIIAGSFYDNSNRHTVL